MKTKKILSLVLCLIMLFSTLSLSASAVIEAWDWDVLVPGDTEKTYRRRNRGKLLQIPLTKESREYVKKYHGKLFFDESHGKKILWRLVK